jgi:hypothetical protein
MFNNNPKNVCKTHLETRLVRNFILELLSMYFKILKCHFRNIQKMSHLSTPIRLPNAYSAPPFRFKYTTKNQGIAYSARSLQVRARHEQNRNNPWCPWLKAKRRESGIAHRDGNGSGQPIGSLARPKKIKAIGPAGSAS